MAQNPIANELFSQLNEPFTGEALFDRLPDLVFFVKNRRAEYVVVNQTLVDRCGRKDKRELLGCRANEVVPPPLGLSYRAQDERILRGGAAVLDQLELHFYPFGVRGWCLTNKVPLRNRAGQIIGLAGISKDLQAAEENAKDYAAVAAVVAKIHARFGEPLWVGRLAADAGLSIYQLEERIRAIFHLTVGQLIQKVRMEHAFRQLIESSAPIAEIALASGYSDQSAFSRQFRQTTGLTPSEYRRLV